MSYQVHRYKHRRNVETQFVESILKIIWFIVSLPFKLIFRLFKSDGSSKYKHVEGMDTDFVRMKWQEIEELVKLGKPSNFARAVLEADKLLDHVLKAYRAPGMTMGDRLKSSRNRFSYEAYDAAWKGQKVRNELVHNAQYELMDYQAKETIENFKKALSELVNF